MLFIFLFIFTRTGENRTDHTASSLLASSFRIASGTSSPCGAHKSKDEPGKFIHFDNGWLRRLGMLLCAMIDASRVTLTVQSAQMAAYARDEMPRACHKKIIKKLDVHEAVLRKHTRGQ
jgi:hypothetical protein